MWAAIAAFLAFMGSLRFPFFAKRRKKRGVVLERNVTVGEGGRKTKRAMRAR